MQDQGKIITADIERLLKLHGFGKEVNSNQNAANNITGSYQSQSWNQDLTSLLQDYFVQIYTASSTDALAEIDLTTDDLPSFHDNAQQYAQEHTAALVTNLDDSTRKMLKTDLSNMMDAGMSPYDIKSQLMDNYAFSEDRAFTIGRTETGFAWNDAAINTYQLGGANAVSVYDGDSDPDCREADGQTWTFDYAVEHRLEHPNCVRSFGPQMEDVTPDRGLDELGDGHTDALTVRTKGGKK